MNAQLEGPNGAPVTQYGMGNGGGNGQGTAGQKGGHTSVSRMAPNPQQPKKAQQPPQAQSQAQQPAATVRLGAQASEVYAGVLLYLVRSEVYAGVPRGVSGLCRCPLVF
jgi:hypothetical protein